MPSDTSLIEAASGVLAASFETFRSTVVSSAEELRGMLSDTRDDPGERAERLAAELGPFAESRIRVEELVAVLGNGDAPASGSAPVITRALEVLEAVAATDGPEAPFVVEVPEGGDLRDVVRDALTHAGRVFGAGRAADLARTGRFLDGEHQELFEGLPPRRWTARERRVAPPLVVRVRKDDLRPAGVADFLEGAQKIVLLVEGSPAPPAALVRLISPGVMVVQARSVDGLAPLADFAGPAVAAVFDAEGPAAFVHDPRRGGLPWERIELEEEVEALWRRRAETPARKTTARWTQDLEYLIELATPPTGADEAPGEGAAQEPSAPSTGADRLAAWLIAKTDLGEDA